MVNKGPVDYRDVLAYWVYQHELDLTLDTDAYADGDVLAATQEIEDVMGVNGGAGMIQSVLVHDFSDQAQALDLIFLRSNVSIGTENAAVSVSDANALEVVGVVEVSEDDYVDLANSQVAHKENLGIAFQCAADDKSLYVAAVSRGDGTYAADGITIKVGVLQGM